jgi:hypothetical protein
MAAPLDAQHDDNEDGDEMSNERFYEILNRYSPYPWPKAGNTGGACGERTSEYLNKEISRGKTALMSEECAICGSEVHRTRDTYAGATIAGRSHASKHHFVAERFFGRSNNRRGTKTIGIFASCTWGHEGASGVFCYECHEELLHNPVLLPEDVARFAQLVRIRGLSETVKSEDCPKLAGRVSLFHELIARGLKTLLAEVTPEGQNSKS